MRAVLITLIGPNRTTDLALDADTPVEVLIPKLLDSLALGDSPDDLNWTLSLTNGTPFDPEATLEESQVLDGSILVLRQSTEQRPSLPSAPVVPPRQIDAAGPRARAHALLAGVSERPERIVASCVLERCPTIAVVSPKGGVGKTTTSLLLGAALAALRPEPVLALDADIDYGSLSRIGSGGESSIFSESGGAALTFAELDRNLFRLPSGLRLVPAPTDPRAVAAIDRVSYTRAINALQRLAGVLVLDCGSGLGQPSVQAAVMACDQLVLVTDTTEPTVALAAESAALLVRSGRPLTVVCNRLPKRRAGATLDKLESRFPAADALVGLPQDSAAAGAISGNLTLPDASRSLREAVLDIAGLLALGWGSLGLARS